MCLQKNTFKSPVYTKVNNVSENTVIHCVITKLPGVFGVTQAGEISLNY